MPMNILGVSVEGSSLVYVRAVIDAGAIETKTQGSISLTASRDSNAIKQFSAQLAKLLETVTPDLVIIREKPENGRMRAGALASKIEVLLLLLADCPVKFASARDCAAVTDIDPGLKKKSEPAFRAAATVLKS